jgi:AraC-like DNA-binding protein
MNAKNNLIESLAGSDMYKQYERAFMEATGLPVSLRPMDAWQLPFHGCRKQNPFCAMIAGKSKACAACLQTQAKLRESATESPATITCSHGLCETAVPVRLGNQTIGYLQTGQVAKHAPTEAQLDEVAKQAKALGLEPSVEAIKEAYAQSPVASAKKMEALTQLLSTFAEHLSIKSNQIAITQANAEPPVIAKAKQYINERQAEDLSLGQVAAAVHTSPFYFCKLFRKATGVTFTEYVSRARTEKAKNLLLNPNLRVSEIAYEAGFQSLTHFNRVFKKIVGESPTSYRERLPKAA